MTLPNALMQIREALDEFDLETARKLLRVELKENPTADTYFLAAQAAIDDQQRRSFLEKAIENDPFHQEARVEFHRLQTRTLNSSTSSLQPIQTNSSSLTQRQSLPIAEEFVYQTSQKGKLLYGDQPISQQLHLHREQQVNVNVTPATVVVINKRSRFVALLLTLLLGPVGMFYSTAPGALIMLVIFILAAAGNAPSGAFLLLWFICIIWSIVAASKTPEVVTK